MSGHGAKADRAPQKKKSGRSDDAEHDSRASGIFYGRFSTSSEGMPAHAGKAWISSRLFGCSVCGAGGFSGHGAKAEHAPQKKRSGRTDRAEHDSCLQPSGPLKKEKKMRIQVNITKEIFAAIKKREVALGKSRSSAAAELIVAGLAHFAAPVPETIKESDSVSGIAPEAVAELLNRERSGLSPEALRYQVQNLAKIENLLRQISRLLSPGNAKEHMERVRVAEGKAQRILKKLKMDAIEDVDRMEMEVLTEGEMLKDLGLDTLTAGGDK